MFKFACYYNHSCFWPFFYFSKLLKKFLPPPRDYLADSPPNVSLCIDDPLPTIYRNIFFILSLSFVFSCWLIIIDCIWFYDNPPIELPKPPKDAVIIELAFRALAPRPDYATLNKDVYPIYICRRASYYYKSSN